MLELGAELSVGVSDTLGPDVGDKAFDDVVLGAKDCCEDGIVLAITDGATLGILVIILEGTIDGVILG